MMDRKICDRTAHTADCMRHYMKEVSPTALVVSGLMGLGLITLICGISMYNSHCRKKRHCEKKAEHENSYASRI